MASVAFGMVLGFAVPGYAIAAGAVTLGMGFLADEVRKLRKRMDGGGSGGGGGGPTPQVVTVRVAGAAARRRRRRRRAM